MSDQDAMSLTNVGIQYGDTAPRRLVIGVPPFGARARMILDSWAAEGGTVPAGTSGAFIRLEWFTMPNGSPTLMAAIDFDGIGERRVSIDTFYMVEGQ